MTQKDRTETRDIIHGVLEGWQEATVQRENLIHQSLNSIDKHLEKINGTVAENVKEISNLKLRDELHIVECPALPKIEKLEKEIIGSWLRKHWRLAIITTIFILYAAYSLFTLVSIEDLIILLTK